MANPSQENRSPSAETDPVPLGTLIKHLRARYAFPVAHAFLFLAMWASYKISNQGLAEGLPGVFFAIVLIADLPFSIVAFGIMFQGGRDGVVAAIAWGVGCTLWWYLLGLGLDALIRRKSGT